MKNITKKRPVHLNLLTIRLPIAGIMSIAHRLAGLMMFALTPFLIYGLDLSLRGPEDFQRAILFFSSGGKLLGMIVLWAIAHHFFAGVRYLLLDLDIGFEKQVYRWSALLVLIGGVGAAVGWGIIQ